MDVKNIPCAMNHRNSKIDAKTALTSMEAEIAEATSVWVVWWEDPDRSWESICTSPEECEREYEARRSDAVLRHWGKAGKSGRQSLLEWVEGHLRVVSPGQANDFIHPAKEVLRRLSAGESGPVVVRTW